MQILLVFLSLFLYFFFFPIRSVLAPPCPVRATSAGAFLCAFLAHHCASPLFLVVASDGIRQKSGEVSLTASLSWSFRGIVSRFLAFMRRVSMRGFVCSFPRDFIPLLSVYAPRIHARLRMFISAGLYPASLSYLLSRYGIFLLPAEDYLFPFALLCVWQSIWQLEISVAPPLDQAVTWSASISVSFQIRVRLAS